MQEAFVGAWERGVRFAGANLHSLRDLNRRFLELAATQGGWAGRAASASGILRLLAPLSRAQREAAASCPYALFDLRFPDAAHWRERLQISRPWCVADEPAQDPETVEFVRLALFYAWHVASLEGITAQLQLGMHHDTTAAFRAMTVDMLPSLAATEAGYLSARWSDCTVYWSALVGAASGNDPATLRRVPLHGLQLAAASHLQ